MTGNNGKTDTQAQSRVIYSMMVSLDGYIEGPDPDLEWVIIDEELHRYVNAQERTHSALLYGRRIYEVMTYWQTADTIPSSLDFEVEYARIWQSIPKIVFSRTLEGVEGNARLVREVSVEQITRLKAEFGGNLGVAGADLASTFMRLGLIDEYQLYVQPVVLGSGKPFFPTLDHGLALQLVGTHTFRSGVELLRYRNADEGR